MNILLFCAKAFETMEFSVFVDVMGWARDDYMCDINVVTCGFQKMWLVHSVFQLLLIQSLMKLM